MMEEVYFSFICERVGSQTEAQLILYDGEAQLREENRVQSLVRAIVYQISGKIDRSSITKPTNGNHNGFMGILLIPNLVLPERDIDLVLALHTTERWSSRDNGPIVMARGWAVKIENGQPIASAAWSQRHELPLSLEPHFQLRPSGLTVAMDEQQDGYRPVFYSRWGERVDRSLAAHLQEEVHRVLATSAPERKPRPRTNSEYADAPSGPIQPSEMGSKPTYQDYAIPPSTPGPTSPTPKAKAATPEPHTHLPAPKPVTSSQAKSETHEAEPLIVQTTDVGTPPPRKASIYTPRSSGLGWGRIILLILLTNLVSILISLKLPKPFLDGSAEALLTQACVPTSSTTKTSTTTDFAMKCGSPNAHPPCILTTSKAPKSFCEEPNIQYLKDKNRQLESEFKRLKRNLGTHRKQSNKYREYLESSAIFWDDKSEEEAKKICEELFGDEGNARFPEKKVVINMRRLISSQTKAQPSYCTSPKVNTLIQ